MDLIYNFTNLIANFYLRFWKVKYSKNYHHEWSVWNIDSEPGPSPIHWYDCGLIHDTQTQSQRFKCRKCGKMFRDLPMIFTCANCGYNQPTRGMITFYGHEVIGARMAKIAERLRFSRKEIEKIETLVRWHMFNYQPSMTDSAIRRLIRKVGKENIADLVLLRISDRKEWFRPPVEILELQKNR
jgi:predicted RNA-binding Zn-ribbon protein involved in translation (DUF1610 family)